MPRTLPTIFALAFIVFFPVLAKDKTASKHDFTAAQVLDIGTSEHVNRWHVFRSALFTARVADLTYTARGARILRRTKDIGQGLIVGDPVQVAVNGDDLILMKPNGKEMKTTIVKCTRARGE